MTVPGPWCEQLVCTARVPNTAEHVESYQNCRRWLVLAIPAGNDSPLFAQTTVATGSIVGTVSDSSKAFISGAKISITSTATAHAIEVTTNSYGAFDSGALTPGDYKAVISAKGFGAARSTVTVLVGNTITLNMTLQIGGGRRSCRGARFTAQVNSEQATVQGVLTEQQIENLPINGRDFYDLARLEPGVQIQDAANFGFGKDVFSSISAHAEPVALRRQFS